LKTTLRELVERIRCPPGLSLRYHPALDRIKILRGRKTILSISHRQVGSFECSDQAIEKIERLLEAIHLDDDRELSALYEAMLTMRKRLQ